MAGGGTFNKASGKTRPGTYTNFESDRQEKLGIAERGTVLLPLIGHTYGPAGEFIPVTAESPDGQREKLGYSIYDDHPQMLLIREAMKNANKVLAYNVKEGTKASYTFQDENGGDPGEGGNGGEPGDNGNGNGEPAPNPDPLVITARYGGSRGNDIIVTSVANPVGGFDITIHLGTELVAEYEGVMSVDALADCPWATFTGTLQEFAGVHLTGGVDGDSTNADITKFLDASEGPVWHTMAFPLESEDSSTLQEAVVSKIKYLRDSVGKYVKAVLAGCKADYEGIINVTNGVVLSDGTELTPAQATAWVAGADAGASYTKSNTQLKYLGAVGIVGEKNHEAAEAAIKNGEFFFSWSEQGEVVVEYDINSLTTFVKPRDKTYSKNRCLRVYDTFGETVKVNFPPNRFDNSPTGWDIMEGLGRAILKLFDEDGAIKNVDYDNDFLVDRVNSSGDETFFEVGLAAVDSAEKLYFTVKTR